MPDSLPPISTAVKEIATGTAPAATTLAKTAHPVVLRGIAKDWALTRQSASGPAGAAAYLKPFYNGRPSMIYRAPASINGRYFYTEDASSLNYQSVTGRVDAFLDELAGESQDESLYMASAPLDKFFPGLKDAVRFSKPAELNPDAEYDPLVSIWVGNRSLASCHFDNMENIACCVAGRRRIIVFPPEQIANLYPGPVERTPGGQVISMVDFHQPDFACYPRFAEALKHAQIAELAPGDGIFIPSMWWHQVEGLSDFNVLVNYWWSQAPSLAGSGMPALFHAMLAIRDRPEREKAAFKALFDYYVFGDSNLPHAHLPESGKGVLGSIDEVTARRLRAIIINQLNK